METIESLEEKCLKILNREGKVTFDELNPIAKATWNAYRKGFMECAEYLLSPVVENHNVCEQCESLGITDINCVCVTERRYKTVNLDFNRCKVCDKIDE